MGCKNGKTAKIRGEVPQQVPGLRPAQRLLQGFRFVQNLPQKNGAPGLNPGLAQIKLVI